MYRQLTGIFYGNRGGLSQSISYVLRRISTETEEIIIPKEIPRGPTDILKALSSTVKPDPTAAHYKYHDDPYLIPYSNLTKRSYALSQEAGRKAAQWVRQEHADLFQHRVADPIVEAFIPKPVYNEESNVSEEILRNSIANTCVTDATTIYNLLKKKGIDVSVETKQSLLELLCYYNSTDPVSEEWIEEKWYRQGIKEKEKWRNFWKENSLIEQLYQELGRNSNAVCTMISGMNLHGQGEKAWELYEYAKSNGIKLNITVYNSLLAKTWHSKENHVLVLKLVQELLQEMIDQKIQPNLDTLNSVLESLSNISKHRNAKFYALNVLAEFKTVGIEPSLATFYHLINMYSSDRENLYDVIVSVLEYLETKEMEIRDIKDTWFFSKTMEIISLRLQDKDLGHRLNNLLRSGTNYDFIGGSLKESFYYRYYFLLLCKTESINDFIEIYDTLVPNIYVPEPAVMDSIFASVEDNKAWNLLPRLWSDIVLFEQDERTQVFERVLRLATMNTDETLNEGLSNLAWSVWTRLEDTTRRPVELTGALLSDLILLLLLTGDLSKAHLVMDKMERLHNTLLGEPNVTAFIKYIDICIKENSPDAAIKCIRYANNIGFVETGEMARKLNNSLPLKQQHIETLISIVGKDELKSNETSVFKA